MDLKRTILRKITDSPERVVWIPMDFLDLGNREAVDKALQRLVKSNQLRRIKRGLYDKPKRNKLTGLDEAPDYKKIIDALAHRDQARMLIDGLTAANDLGLTNAVPGQITILTDGRMQPVIINNLSIQFKRASPSKLYWAGRPAMRIVQALYWLRDVINNDQSLLIKKKLIHTLIQSKQRSELIDDLLEGLYTLPSWMQNYLKEIISSVQK